MSRLLATASDFLEDANANIRRAAEYTLCGLYKWSDRRPWRLGYIQYKLRYLSRLLQDEATLSCFRRSQQLPQGHGRRLDARVVEIPWVLANLESTTHALLDAGSSLNYSEVLTSHPLSGKAVTVFTLAPEKRCFWNVGASYVFGDLRDLRFKDECFDAIACISTIEHVGMDNSLYAGNSQAARSGCCDEFLVAIRELKRVLRKQHKLFMTFPFGRYEHHGWFQQFDSALTDRLIAEFAPSEVKETVYQYTDAGWKQSDRAQCSECQFFDVRKSRYYDSASTIDFPPHFPAGEGAVICLELTK